MNEPSPLLLGDKPLPHSDIMEKSVLSCFICWPDELSLEFDRLRAEDFYIPANRRIYEGIMKLREDKKPIDAMQLCNKLHELDSLNDVGGIDNIRTIANTVSHHVNFESYLQEVQKNGRARRLITVCSSLVGQLYEPEANVNQIVSEAETEIIKVSNEGSVKDVRYVRDCIPAAREHILGLYEKDPNSLGIDSGYRALNEMITGFMGGKTYVIAARPSIGKCLGYDTPVLMFDGSIKPVQDIVVGDLLLGPDGKSRRVESLARGTEEMWKVKPYRGMEYIVNESHILSFKLNSDGTDWAKYYAGKQYRPGDIINLTVREYLSLSKRKKHHLKGWKSETIDFRISKPLPQELDPYFLGIWLGDGNNSNQAIHNPDIEVHEWLELYASNLNYHVSYCDVERCPRVTIANKKGAKNKVNEALKSFSLLYNKHIPHEYKTASIDDRFKLLAGIIDSDGYWNKQCCYEVLSKYEPLAYDLQYLCHSLGLRATIKKVKKGIASTDFVGEYYRVSIFGDVARIPVKIERKKATGYKPKRNVNTSCINLEPQGIGFYYGFTLSGPDRLFMLGDFTVTHNTTFLLNIISRMGSISKVGFFSLEMTETECTEKLISLFGNIDPNSVYSESIEYEDLLSALDIAQSKLDNIDLIIDDSTYHFEDLVHRIKLLYVKEGIQAVAIDYLQLMTMLAKTDNKEQMVSKMSSDLKKLAKALNIPIIILAQLNRGSEGKMPLLSDLRDSGAIEQDADVVALLHRDRVDTPELREQVEQGQALETKLILAKNRGGKTGPLDLWFFPQYSMFQEPSGIDDRDIPE